MVFYGIIVLVMVGLFYRLPTGFLPDEDQGFIINLITLPSGTTQPKTLGVARQVSDHYLKDEQKNVDMVFTVAGFSFLGVGQNAGITFARLRPWDERPGAARGAGLSPGAHS